jgi:threonine dehydrogenase-like Zn-dependent dehydrogenase
MKELKTWKGASFKYSGSIETGVIIYIGTTEKKEEVTQTQCNELLKKFIGIEVLMDAIRPHQYSNSLGHWLEEEIKPKRVITSYISSILVDEGYAFFVNSPSGNNGCIIKFN